MLVQDGKTISENFTVPSVVTVDGTEFTVTWKSNNEIVTIVDLDENYKNVVVDYQSNKDGNKTVILTATISKGKNRIVKNFSITVPKFVDAGILNGSISSPQVGVEYLLAIPQKAKDAVYYFTGNMSGYYGATETDYSLGVSVKLVQVEGGYHVTFEKDGKTNYINAVKSGKHLNFVFGETASNVWTWNEEYCTLLTYIDNVQVFMGTNDNYVTFGMLEVSKIDKSTSYPARLYNIPNGSQDEEQGGSKPNIDPTKEITIEQAIEICEGLSDKTEVRYLIRATVKSINKPEFGAMTIEDETGTISVYGSYSSDGSLRYGEMTEKPYANYEVLLSCILQNFNGKAEIYSAWILEFKELEDNFTEADYEAMTINQARSEKEGAKVKLTGVVAKITYANGMIPSGFYLVDNTNSIYVYDNQIAPRVAEGDKITICAERTNWILADEQNNAQKFGYTGCIQVANSHLIGEAVSNQELDLSWVTESTVKEIMDTPTSNNITTTIYKVNAYVSKQEGKGFTNYYINDIDGKTGSYSYTQCNGSDFSWLDEFDGKICTVYLSVINAKSTNSTCLWRFLPVKVVYENYKFDLTKSAEYAITYHVLDQFLETYTGNPKLELITNVSNEALGIDNVSISYSSSNTDVVYFENLDNKVVLNTKKLGTAEITITAKYGEITASKKINITVSENDLTDVISIEEAIALEVGQTATVKGIVGPSLINKTGFYLMCENALIAIETTPEVMETIEIGYEVVVTGTRHLNVKDSATHGQVCLNNASVVANYYGEHELPTSYFEEVKGEYFSNLDVNENHSTTAYIVEGVVTFTETQYYSNVSFQTTDGKKITLYCSSGKQYKWLSEACGNATVKLAIAPCNWNSKAFYAGCVLYAILEDGTIVYNNVNFN